MLGFWVLKVFYGFGEEGEKVKIFDCMIDLEGEKVGLSVFRLARHSVKPSLFCCVILSLGKWIWNK